MNQKNILYLVIPCYKEKEVLLEIAKKLFDKMKGMVEKNAVSERSK